jgi:hypothetical protein
VANWDDQGKQYAAFIEAELQGENDRRASVNTRAAAALTGATGLVTLVLAIFAVFVGKDFVLAGSAKRSLALALLALLSAAVFAVLAGIPWTSTATKPETLRSFLRDTTVKGDQGWNNSEVTARNFTARCNVHAIESLRPGTNLKFRLLVIAGAFQVLAVLCLVICTLIVVNAKPAQRPTPAPPSCCLMPSGTSSRTTTPPSSTGTNPDPHITTPAVNRIPDP